MALIERLSPEVASRIAAGEVAERPFNVVKELIENSVDAGATKITVEIVDGGLTLIRVTDDGKGIDGEDLPLALERFATSKARSVEDVYSAKTFGFRGEALAAVSAVSDFTLRSGTDSGKSYEIRSIFGEVSDIKPAPPVKGTMAEAQNLFENVPARRKFLKSFRSLETEIVKLIKHFSLINPNIEISVYSNGKLAYEAFANEDICVRGAKVFAGKGFAKGEVEYGSSKVTVAATLPAVSDRLKRDGIIIGVNGRLIKDQSLIQAVVQAYHRLIPDGRFPAAAVDIRINPDELDPNVHPAKLEVRFEKPKDIFCFVTDAVASSFKGKNDGFNYQDVDRIGSKPFIMKEPTSISDTALPFSEKEAVTPSFNTPTTPKTSYAFDLTKIDYQPKVWDNNVVADSFIESDTKEEIYSQNINMPDFRIVGQVADTYIICETHKGELMFIDQHAAHERILFEKNQAKDDISKTTIVLHDKIKVNLNEEQYQAAFENMDTIESYGYSFYDVGDYGIEITRVPQSAIRKNIASVFEKIISELYVSGRSKTEDAPRALLSCKAAIKAGDKLTHMEMEYLTELLFNTNNYGTCPHGRPIIYTMGISELARKFLR